MEESLPDMHKRIGINQPLTIAQNGFIYIWVSNESENTKVWFDDLKITHTSSLVTQATDFGVWGDVLREQKSDESKYRFGYQGQFAEKDEETGWNHFELREYDPIIGRWLVPDPMNEFWSPYLAMGNNPVNSVDPNGGCTGDCDYDPASDPAFHGEHGEVLVNGFRSEDMQSGFNNFRDMAEEYNYLGRWLERNFELPKGEGIAFYSTTPGEPWHTRDGDVTHSAVDIQNILKNLGGSSFKTLSKKDKIDIATMLKLAANVKTVVKAYKLSAKLSDPAKQAIVELCQMMHDQVNGNEIDSTGQTQFPTRHYTAREFRAGPNDATVIKRDTLWHLDQ